MSEEVTITSQTPHEKEEWYCQWYQCPECKNAVEFNDKIIESTHIAYCFKFCPDCGRKIVWALDAPARDSPT